jgi:hypothetical protein
MVDLVVGEHGARGLGQVDRVGRVTVAAAHLVGQRDRGIQQPAVEHRGRLRARAEQADRADDGHDQHQRDHQAQRELPVQDGPRLRATSVHPASSAACAGRAGAIASW